MIIVDKTSFKFIVSNEEFPRNLYIKWDEFSRANFENIVEEVLSKYNKYDSVFQIDSLKLDLGTIPEEDFYTQFPIRLKEELERKLVGAFLSGNKKLDLSSKQFRLDNLFFYILNGYQTAYYTSCKINLADEVRFAIDDYPREFMGFLIENRSNKIVAERLVLQSKDDLLIEILVLFSHWEMDFILSLLHWFLNEKILKEIEVSSYHHTSRDLVWLTFFRYLQQSNCSDSKDIVAGRILERISQQTNKASALKIMTFIKGFSIGSKSRHDAITIQKILNDTTSSPREQTEQFNVLLQSDPMALIDHIRMHNDMRVEDRLVLLLSFSAIDKIISESAHQYSAYIKNVILWSKDNYLALGAKYYPNSDSYDFAIRKAFISLLREPRFVLMSKEEIAIYLLSTIFDSENLHLIADIIERENIVIDNDLKSALAEGLPQITKRINNIQLQDIQALLQSKSPLLEADIISIINFLRFSDKRQELLQVLKEQEYEKLLYCLSKDNVLSHFILELERFFAAIYNFYSKTESATIGITLREWTIILFLENRASENEWIYSFFHRMSLYCKCVVSQLVNIALFSIDKQGFTYYGKIEEYILTQFRSNAPIEYKVEGGFFDHKLTELRSYRILLAYLVGGDIIDSTISPDSIYDLYVSIENSQLTTQLIADLEKADLRDISVATSGQMRLHAEILSQLLPSIKSFPGDIALNSLLAAIKNGDSRVVIYPLRKLTIALLSHQEQLFLDSVGCFLQYSRLTLEEQMLIDPYVFLNIDSPSKLIKEKLDRLINEVELSTPVPSNPKHKQRLEELIKEIEFSNNASVKLKQKKKLIDAVQLSNDVSQKLKQKEKLEKIITAIELSSDASQRLKYKAKLKRLTKEIQLSSNTFQKLKYKESLENLITQMLPLEHYPQRLKHKQRFEKLISDMELSSDTSQRLKQKEKLEKLTNDIQLSSEVYQKLKEKEKLDELAKNKELSNDDFFELWQKEELAKLSNDVLLHVLERILLSDNKRLCDYWRKSNNRQQDFILKVLNNNGYLQLLFIKYVGTLPLHQLIEEWISLQAALPILNRVESEVYNTLSKLTEHENISLSESQMGSKFLDNISLIINHNEKSLFMQVLNNKKTELPILGAALEEILGSPLENENNLNEPHKEAIIRIENAGLTLLSPWLPRLFKMLDYINEDGKDFKTIEAKIRAIFVLQYILYSDDANEYHEHELIFNRLLTGCPFNIPLPKNLLLTDMEKESVDSMLVGVKNNWDKLKNTSIDGFQTSFLRRPGHIKQDDEKWMIYVDTQSYDILLDSLPWAYKLIRYKWLSKLINVEWR